MKIATYNLNGIRAAMNKGWLQWIEEHNFDIVCVQELKADPSQLDLSVFEKMGYHAHWFAAEKKGYSGVAVFSRQKPDHVEYGCGQPEFDREGRVLRCDFGELSVFSIYFPSGTTGELRQGVKYQFLDFMLDYLQNIQLTRKKLIVCGDYNIAHREIDIHNPKSNKNTSGFLPAERVWMDKFFDSGFTDGFRYLNNEPHQYTWWSVRFNARAGNKGWRIDYISVTNNLMSLLKATAILPDAMHSDHCPMMLEIDI